MGIISIRNFVRIFKRIDISKSETCEHIPLKYINFMFKNFGYVPNNSVVHSKRFNPRVLGMDLDGDIITAKSINPFKSKYCYVLAVDIKRKYFVVVRAMHYKNDILNHDYNVKRSCEMSATM